VRVLLDEQLPRQLAPYLVGHTVTTVQQLGWAGLKNGELLARAESSGLDAVVTADQNIQFQQNLRGRRLRIVVLVTQSNALEDIVPVVPKALSALAGSQPGELIRVAV